MLPGSKGPCRRAFGTTNDKNLGAFFGVFTPSILTILGVIMYLRTGWMVGSVGVLPALGVVVIANLVTLISGNADVVLLGLRSNEPGEELSMRGG